MLNGRLRTHLRLWKQMVPLSMSDITMAFGDPILTAGIVRLPLAQLSLAALGLAKSIAVFFESPVIMLLHASNVFAASPAATKALRRFAIMLLSGITIALGILVSTPVFPLFARRVLGLEGAVLNHTREILSFLVLWPAVIGWRRYFQGKLIHAGETSTLAYCGFARLMAVAAIVALGVSRNWSTSFLAGTALTGGIAVEAGLVTLTYALKNLGTLPKDSNSSALPTTSRGVWRFYWPLAGSMVVVWGSRAALLAVIARSVDSVTSLGAWSAAWGILVVIANSTRMLQQIIIRNYKLVGWQNLSVFALSVASVATGFLSWIVLSSSGQEVLGLIAGDNVQLLQHIASVLTLGLAIPGLVAFQNALQGFLMLQHRTVAINLATFAGSAALLFTSWVLVTRNLSGTVAAVIGMNSAFIAEISVLALLLCQATLKAKFLTHLSPLFAQTKRGGLT